MKRWQKIAVIGVIVAFVVLLQAWALAGYPTQALICEPPDSTKDCTSHNILFALVRHALYELNFYGVLITAVATAAIGRFTWTIKGINQSQLAHSHQVERAYFSGGCSIETRRSQRAMADLVTRKLVERREPTGNVEIHVNNYGKTPGEMLEISVEFCEASAIPAEPIYNRSTCRDWIAPGTEHRVIDVRMVPEKISNPVVYARLYYRDIFSEKVHSCGFIQDIQGHRSRTLRPPTRAYTDWD